MRRRVLKIYKTLRHVCGRPHALKRRGVGIVPRHPPWIPWVQRQRPPAFSRFKHPFPPLQGRACIQIDHGCFQAVPETAHGTRSARFRTRLPPPGYRLEAMCVSGTYLVGLKETSFAVCAHATKALRLEFFLGRLLRHGRRKVAAAIGNGYVWIEIMNASRQMPPSYHFLFLTRR
jgi:hypothetical protein